ncbi:MAG TPA: APC family permease [Candidatus Bathyarchaeia archaeon]|nr:APC family permease [Candidatus Bathyarchaeia archaeon]
MNPEIASGAIGHPGLLRRLGLLNAISINMSNMVGTGPFITVPAILATMGGPQSLIAWGVGAMLAIADGLVFAELGSAIPASGGSYIFLRECLGRERWGHMMAWIFVWQFLFSGTLEIATSSIGMAQYTGFLWPGLLAHTWGVKLLAAAITAVAMLALYRKIHDIAKLMLVLWVGMLLTAVWVIYTGMTHMEARQLLDFPPGAWHIGLPFMLGLGNGTMLVMFNFLGYYQICYLGDEVKEPERVVPYGVIVSILIVTAIDFLISASFTGVVPWQEMIRPESQAFTAIGSVYMAKVGGHVASQVMTIMVEVTAFAATYAMMLGYSRIPYAAALDGAFFRWFGELHSTKRFPHRSLLLVGVLVMVACFFDLVQIITALMLARILSMFVAQIIGLLIYRRTRPDAPRPFRMWLYPLPALFALVGWLGVFVTPALQPGGWKFMAYAFGTIGMGFAAYLILASRKKEWPFANRREQSVLIG